MTCCRATPPLLRYVEGWQGRACASHAGYVGHLNKYMGSAANCMCHQRVRAKMESNIIHCGQHEHPDTGKGLPAGAGARRSHPAQAARSAASAAGAAASPAAPSHSPPASAAACCSCARGTLVTHAAPWDSSVAVKHGYTAMILERYRQGPQGMSRSSERHENSHARKELGSAAWQRVI